MASAKDKRDELLNQTYRAAFRDLADLAAALGSVLSVSTDEASLFKEVSLYQGFDPKRILSRFYNISIQDDATEGMYTIAVGNGAGAPWTLPKKISFREDLLFFVGLYATRGTDCGKLADKSTPEFAAVIKAKATVYGISCDPDYKRARGRRTKRVESSLAADKITLGRLASCVPHLVCDFYKHGMGRPLLDLDSKFDKFPPGLRHNQLASIWPSDPHYPVGVVYFVAYLIDKKINPGMERQDLSTMLGYQDAALQSTFLSNPLKQQIMREAGAHRDGDVDCEVFLTFLAMAEEWDTLLEGWGREGILEQETVDAIRALKRKAKPVAIGLPPP